jgi:hypothetical protein
MLAQGSRLVEDLPTPFLEPEAELGVFTEGMELGEEDLAVDRDIVESLAPK